MADSYSFQTNKGDAYPATPLWSFPSSAYSYSPMATSLNTHRDMDRFGSNVSDRALGVRDASDFVIAPSGYLKYGVYRLLGLALWSHVNVATTLLRIQYLPNEATKKKIAGLPSAAHPRAETEEEEEEDINSSPETMLVVDALASPLPSKYATSQKPAQVDKDGYLVYSPYLDESEGARPPHFLPKLTSSHIWPTVRCIRQHPYEGVLGLYKGLFTDFLKQMAIETLEPSLSSVLCELLGLDDSLEPVDLDNPLPMSLVYLFSRVFVDWVVSPLEHTKTWLMVRSRQAPGFAFPSIFRKVCPLSFSHPHYVLPTLAVSLIYHGCVLATPLLIDRGFGISSIYNPFQYALYECLCHVARDLILLPLYTIQLRLSVQRQEGMTVVDRSPIPYTGMWDCFKRILFEERGQKWKLFSPLYKGLRIALWSHVFHLCVRITGEYMDWEAMFEDETF